MARRAERTAAHAAPGRVATVSSALVWFRQDLRLADHPALQAAVASCAAIVPVYVWAPEDEGRWLPGGAARWYLARSLASLDASLRERGSQLVFARGPARDVLPQLARDCGAEAVHWSRRYEPHALQNDADVERALRAQGIGAHAHSGSLLCEPWAVRNGTGGPYKVFTPFWRAHLAQVSRDAPLPAPTTLRNPAHFPRGVPLQALGICPPAAWHAQLARHWQPGEAAARAGLRAFVEGPLRRYATERDRPDLASVSRLSPRLRHGELSPRQVWRAAVAAQVRAGVPEDEARGGKFCAELVWREFAAHVLYHFPDLADVSLQRPYEELAWRTAPAELVAWQRGRTGIDIVDAGMRELWDSGWMHNRVRMICASLLVKNLLIHWRHGAQWFWDTLVDADLANNSLNWQWVAGTGADAAPWFRIFNPHAQADRFDPDAAYRRRWLGEGASGATAPLAAPIVDLATSRARALRAQQELKKP
jgi:deoxyribodipyrimidine photo-lyase